MDDIQRKQIFISPLSLGINVHPGRRSTGVQLTKKMNHFIVIPI
ncbi:hypothetical protein Cs308_0961 [Candidatus Chlamydia sanziniae]|uniref:Uncharacterized protein n=1 Tax=Candidatus Chlamydia sanziniae TaxID=1806891 RepID=A0A1A9HXG5_9CHLA|nr:hypothetical protein Cs308_0961 [Candidatus Chlamydia sanziniae]